MAEHSLSKQLPPKWAGTLTNLLTQFVPGYSIINAVIREYLGIDADKVLAILGFWFGGWAALGYIKNVVWPRILSSFTSTLIVEPEHRVFDDLTRWLSKQTVSQNARLIKVVDKTNLNSAANVRAMRFSLDGPDPYGNNMDEEYDSALVPQDENVIFNYAASEARRPLRFEPAEGTFYFFHRWQLFILKRYAAERGAFRNLASEDAVQLSCLGFSTEPLRRVIEEARQAVWAERITRTSIFRPHAHGFGGRGTSWSKTLTRISRPFDTITMEPDVKHGLIADINEYMMPSKARWYSARGIPYRRGYLFSGPPGCGKTSVSYALAGTFGLDIFVANLSDGKISDQSLSGMLSDLPSRCIVLLEDIDSSGIGRGKHGGASDSEDEADHTTRKELATTHKSHRSHSHQYGITLSGLLNAIDGVASHEGHVMILTTNNPELLDPALKRPGRVDKTVFFSLTTHHQIREIFVRMFSEPSSDGTVKATTTISDLCGLDNDLLTNRQSALLPAPELRALANAFATQIPENAFSHAEIQGYLLAHKGQPQKAVNGTSSWVAEEPLRKEAAAEENARLRKERRKKRRDLAKQGAGGMGPFPGYPFQDPALSGTPGTFDVLSSAMADGRLRSTSTQTMMQTPAKQDANRGNEENVSASDLDANIKEYVAGALESMLRSGSGDVEGSKVPAQ